MALWFGSVTGLCELGMVSLQRALHDRISMGDLRTNHYFVGMIPLANLALFAAIGLLLGVLLRKRPGLGRLVTGSTLAGLLTLALLLRFEGLYPVARAALALGGAMTVRRWLLTSASRLDRLVRLSLPALMGSVVVLIAASVAWVSTTERRALGRLPTASPTAPNVLLLVLDNVRAASMSLHGHPRPTTPNLERIARTGVRFEFARSTAPWTLPSHSSMFTGQWPHRTSVGWDRALDATFPTLAEYLTDQGYATAGFVGNVYYCNERYGLGRGFARYDDFYENQTVSASEILRSASLGEGLNRLLGQGANIEGFRRKTAALLNHDLLEWLARKPPNRPFFAFVNYYDAHAPCVLPENAPRKFGHCNRPEQERIEALKRYQRLDQRGPKKGTVDAATVTREAVEILRDSYESCIAYIDDQVGRLHAELEKQGLLENTLIIVTADHGEHFNERGYLGHGQSVYRREVDVPLLILPPSGRVEPTVVSEPVTLRDLPQTVVDMIPAGTPAGFPGRSLARFWNAGASQPALEEPVLSEVDQKVNMPVMDQIPSTMGAVKAVFSEGRIFIRNTNGHEELYDVSNDPHERTNLVYAPGSSATVTRYRNKLDALLNAAGSATEVP